MAAIGLRSAGSWAELTWSTSWVPLLFAVLELVAKEGTFFFLVDQTVCSFQGQCVENTYNTRNTKRRPTKSHAAEDPGAGPATASSWAC